MTMMAMMINAGEGLLPGNEQMNFRRREEILVPLSQQALPGVRNPPEVQQPPSFVVKFAHAQLKPNRMAST